MSDVHGGSGGWKRGLLLCALVMAGCTVYAEPRPVYRRPVYYYYPPPPQPVYVAPPPTYVAPPPAVVAAPQSDPALQQLLAPIALYPDPLLAVVLPAATFPDQVQAANQLVQANPNPPDPMIDAQPWDASVKALVRYPTVLAYMGNDPQWTSSVGSAFATNQQGVSAAIQDLRAQAQANGSLVSSPQATVISDNGLIAIQPTDPAYIYVPTYDPVLVYHGYYALGWGPRYATGVWLVNGWDWGGGVIVVGDWHGGWAYDHGWHRDPYWHGYPRAAYWHRDARWGPPPHFAHYAVRHDMEGRAWHPVAVHDTPARRAMERPGAPNAYRGQTNNQHPAYNVPGAHQGMPQDERLHETDAQRRAREKGEAEGNH